MGCAASKKGDVSLPEQKKDGPVEIKPKPVMPKFMNAPKGVDRVEGMQEDGEEEQDGQEEHGEVNDEVEQGSGEFKVKKANMSGDDNPDSGLHPQQWNDHDDYLNEKHGYSARVQNVSMPAQRYDGSARNILVYSSSISIPAKYHKADSRHPHRTKDTNDDEGCR